MISNIIQTEPVYQFLCHFAGCAFPPSSAAPLQFHLCWEIQTNLIQNKHKLYIIVVATHWTHSCVFESFWMLKFIYFRPFHFGAADLLWFIFGGHSLRTVDSTNFICVHFSQTQWIANGNWLSNGICVEQSICLLFDIGNYFNFILYCGRMCVRVFFPCLWVWINSIEMVKLPREWVNSKPIKFWQIYIDMHVCIHNGKKSGKMKVIKKIQKKREL